MARRNRRGDPRPDPAVQRAEGTVQRAEGTAEPAPAAIGRVSRWAKWVEALRPYRVYINFAHADGNLRAAGMGYQSLFAVFAAVWVGFSVASYWIVDNEKVFDALVALINRAVPGLIATGTVPGAIPEADLQNPSSYGWTGLIAAGGLIWTAIGWLYYTRQAGAGGVRPQPRHDQLRAPEDP